MEFLKVSQNVCDNLFDNELVLDKDVYILKNDNIVGYGFIKKDNKETIYFHILEKYRGNGYGNILFHNLLNAVKSNYDYKDIELSIEKDNIRSNRIIKNCGGIEILFEDNKIFYVIPLR